MRLPISHYLLRWSYLAPFLTYGDLFFKNCDFFLPYSHLTLSLVVNDFEFLDEISIAKTRFLGLSVGDDFVIAACVVLTIPACDGRWTDR